MRRLEAAEGSGTPSYIFSQSHIAHYSILIDVALQKNFVLT